MVSGEKDRVKRSLLILTIVALYVVAISFAMKYLPCPDPPTWIRSHFTKSTYVIAWIKIWYTVVVLFISGLLALLLVRYDRRTAQFDAYIIGSLSVLWGVVFTWAITGEINVTWEEITDNLTIWLAIPALVAVVNRVSKMLPPSNQPLEPIH